MTMDWKKLDWKFFLTIVATIAGVVIPVYLWQTDATSRTIEVKLLSSSALQPATNIQDLQIFLNGKKIESPFLSSFELTNTGSKSILSADFETPIEILPKKGVTVVSAQVTRTDPVDIPVKISFDEHRVFIAPFLSNPKDTIAFSIITSGEQPVFESRARIAGIKAIAFEDSSKIQIQYGRISLSLISGLALFILCMMFFNSTIFGVSLPSTKTFAFFTSAACYLGAGAAFVDLVERIKPFPFSTGIMVGIAIVVTGLGIFVIEKMIRREFSIKRQGPNAPHPWDL
jgi:hypothetical protein